MKKMYTCRPFHTMSPTQSNDYVLALDMVRSAATKQWLCISARYGAIGCNKSTSWISTGTFVIMQISLKQFCKKLKHFHFSFIAIVTNAKIKQLCKLFILVLLQLWPQLKTSQFPNNQQLKYCKTFSVFPAWRGASSPFASHNKHSDRPTVKKLATGRHGSRGVCLPWLSYQLINRKHLWHQPPKCHHSCCHAELRKSDLEVMARHLNEVEAVQHVYLTNIPVWFGLLGDI